jgi:hypothetical protein
VRHSVPGFVRSIVPQRSLPRAVRTRCGGVRPDVWRSWRGRASSDLSGRLAGVRALLLTVSFLIDADAAVL